MSRPREVEPIRRCHLLLFEEDCEFLNEHFGHSIGFSKAARTIVHAFVKQLRAKAEDRHRPISDVVIDDTRLDIEKDEG